MIAVIPNGATDEIERRLSEFIAANPDMADQRDAMIHDMNKALVEYGEMPTLARGKLLLEFTPTPEPTPGVLVEEPFWLGAHENGDGAAVSFPEFVHTVRVVPAWRDPDDEGKFVTYDKWNSSSPHLEGAQLRNLADFIADLHQCTGCRAWYKSGTKCPTCGQERGR